MRSRVSPLKASTFMSTTAQGEDASARESAVKRWSFDDSRDADTDDASASRP